MRFNKLKPVHVLHGFLISINPSLLNSFFHPPPFTPSPPDPASFSPSLGENFSRNTVSITDGNGGLRRRKREKMRLIDVIVTSITDSFASNLKKPTKTSKPGKVEEQ